MVKTVQYLFHFNPLIAGGSLIFLLRNANVHSARYKKISNGMRNINDILRNYSHSDTAKNLFLRVNRH